MDNTSDGLKFLLSPAKPDPHIFLRISSSSPLKSSNQQDLKTEAPNESPEETEEPEGNEGNEKEAEEEAEDLLESELKAPEPAAIQVVFESESAPSESLPLPSLPLSSLPLPPLNLFGNPVSALDLLLKETLGVAEFADDQARIETLGENLPTPLFAGRKIFTGFRYENHPPAAVPGERRIRKTQALKLALGMLSEEDLAPGDFLTEEEFQVEYAAPEPYVPGPLPAEEQEEEQFEGDDEEIPHGDDETDEALGGEGGLRDRKGKGKELSPKGEKEPEEALEVTFQPSADGAEADEIEEFVVKEPNVNDLLYKTSMCKLYMTKRKCHYGARCKHAHSKAELRPSPLLKTMLCRDIFQPKAGRRPYCENGSDCQRAHTLEELREIPTELGPLHWKRHPKKSQLCKDNAKGFCPYAQFCWFAHQPEDLIKPTNAPEFRPTGERVRSSLPLYRVLERETEEDDPMEDDEQSQGGGDSSGTAESRMQETVEFQGFQGATWDD